MGVKAAGASG